LASSLADKPAVLLQNKSLWKFVCNLQVDSTIPNEGNLGEIKAPDDQVANLFASYFSFIFVDTRVKSETDLLPNTSGQFSFLPFHISISIYEVFTSLKSLSNTRS